MLVLCQLNRATVHLTHMDRWLVLTFIRQQSNNVSSAVGFFFIDLPSFKSVHRIKLDGKYTLVGKWMSVMVYCYSVFALLSPVLNSVAGIWYSSALEKGATGRLLSAGRAPQIHLIHIHIERPSGCLSYAPGLRKKNTEKGDCSPLSERLCLKHLFKI